MIIGNGTRLYLENNNLNLLEIYTNEVKYNTRLQKRINKSSKVLISVNTTKRQIKLLIKNLDDTMSGIKYYKSENWCKGIEISLNNEIFTLKGKIKNLYNFLNNKGIYLLSEIWNDQFDNKYHLTNNEYNNNFKIEKLNIDIDCSICLNKIQENVIKTKCNHYFHNKCLHNWLTLLCIKPTCPNCRISLDIY